MARLYSLTICLLFLSLSCSSHTIEWVFNKYKNLPDRNYLDVSADMKSDVDSMVTNNIFDSYHKEYYLMDFHKRITRIDAIAIPNAKILNTINDDILSLEGYEPFTCTMNALIDRKLVTLNGVFDHTPRFDFIEFYLHEAKSKFIIKADSPDITYLICIEGQMTDEDLQRIAHSLNERWSRSEDVEQKYDIIPLDDVLAD